MKKLSPAAEEAVTYIAKVDTAIRQAEMLKNWTMRSRAYEQILASELQMARDVFSRLDTPEREMFEARCYVREAHMNWAMADGISMSCPFVDSLITAQVTSYYSEAVEKYHKAINLINRSGEQIYGPASQKDLLKPAAGGPYESSLDKMFEGSAFPYHIGRYCKQQNWGGKIHNENFAVVDFKMESGRDLSCYILRLDSTLQFSVASSLQFSTIEEIPGHIATALMMRSSNLKYGSWCIEQLEDICVFTVVHSVEWHLMDDSFFPRVVRSLVIECEEVEDNLAQ